MIGKTTLLRQLYQAVGKECAIYSDLSHVCHFGPEADSEAFLERLWWSILYDAPSVNRETSRPPRHRREFIRTLFEVAERDFTGDLTLFLDEFHPSIPLLSTMRAVHQEQALTGIRITVVTAGVIDPAEIEEDSSPYNVSTLLPLGVLDVDEAQAIVDRGFVDSGIEIADSTVEAILDVSGCFPPLLQELCRWLYEQSHKGQLPKRLSFNRDELFDLIVSKGDDVLHRFSYFENVLENRELLELLCRLLKDEPVLFLFFIPTIRKAYRYGLIKRSGRHATFLSPLHRHCIQTSLQYMLSNLSAVTSDRSLPFEVTQFLQGLNPQTLGISVVHAQEIHMSNDKIHVEGVIGPVNIKSALEQVTQMVSGKQGVDAGFVAEWTQLLNELQLTLEGSSNLPKEDVERILESTRTVGTELKKEKPNKRFLELSLEGLKEAAKAVEGIATPVVNVVSKIVAFVTNSLDS